MMMPTTHMHGSALALLLLASLFALAAIFYRRIGKVYRARREMQRMRKLYEDEGQGV